MLRLRHRPSVAAVLPGALARRVAGRASTVARLVQTLLWDTSTPVSRFVVSCPSGRSVGFDSGRRLATTRAASGCACVGLVAHSYSVSGPLFARQCATQARGGATTHGSITRAARHGGEVSV